MCPGALGCLDNLRLSEFVRIKQNRYRTVNLTRTVESIQKLEVRMHGGTTDFNKIALWISLWMQLFNRSRYVWPGRGRSGPVFRGGNRPVTPWEAHREDIVGLLEDEDIHLAPGFVQLLRARRDQLRASWFNALPLRAQSWANYGWYDHPMQQRA